MRRRNGTPAQRQFSISTSSATNVSVSESGATPSSVPVALVLAAHDAGRVERLHRLEDLQLLGGEGLRVERRRRLHRDEAERLEEVCHDHVAERPGALVEAGAASDRERLGHVDLDVVDVVAVPDRLEQAVREAQREDVLHGLLAEEVVDSEDLRLVEDAVNRVVQRASGLEVGPERLLEDDARALARARSGPRPR